MRDDRFEWDDRKAAANLKKHGVSFDEARGVFDDARFVERDDPDPDEVRTQIIGRVGKYLLTVIYTERHQRDGSVRQRIITAREATPYEEADYRNG